AFCGLFLIGLVDWRKPVGLRTLDLLALVSLSVSLWFFNHGNVFAAMPLAYPPLLWALARCVWLARVDRPARGAPVWPMWLLLAMTVFRAGFRVGLNARAANALDAGDPGVVAAERGVHGHGPSGRVP